MDAPVLDDITEVYYKAFGILSRARSFTSNGVSLPISFEAVDRYANRFEVLDFEDFLYIISGIDDEYLTDESKRRKQRDRKGKRGAKKRSHS